MNLFCKKGFSLVEMLMVLSILVVLFSFSIPTFFNLNKYKLKSELDRLFVVCSYLQQKAMACNKTQKLFFDLKQHSYYYFGVNNKKCEHKLQKQLFFGFLVSVKGPPGDPKCLISRSVTFDSRKKIPTAMFLYDGKVSPGTIYFVNKKEKIMGALTCSLSQVSYLRKYLYENNSWVVL